MRSAFPAGGFLLFLFDRLASPLDLACHIRARPMAFLVGDVSMDRQIGVEQDTGDLIVGGIRAHERTHDGPNSLGAVVAIFLGLWPFPDQAPCPDGQLLAKLGRQVVQG